MNKIVTITLIIVGLVNFLPVVGVIGIEQLSKLYGISFDEPNLSILMRHRALLFGLLGLFLFYSSAKPQYQLAAIVLGLSSMLSFVVLAWITGDYNNTIERIVIIDIVASVALLIAAGFYWLSASQTFSLKPQP